MVQYAFRLQVSRFYEPTPASASVILDAVSLVLPSSLTCSDGAVGLDESRLERAQLVDRRHSDAVVRADGLLLLANGDTRRHHVGELARPGRLVCQGMAAQSVLVLFPEMTLDLSRF